MAHPGVGGAVALLRHRLVKDEADGGLQPRLRVDFELGQPFHEAVEVFRGQFVEDGSQLPQHFLSLLLFLRCPQVACKLPKQGSPGIFRLVERLVSVQRKAGDEPPLVGLPSLTCLKPVWISAFEMNKNK